MFFASHGSPFAIIKSTNLHRHFFFVDFNTRNVLINFEVKLWDESQCTVKIVI